MFQAKLWMIEWILLTKIQNTNRHLPLSTSSIFLLILQSFFLWYWMSFYRLLFREAIQVCSQSGNGFYSWLVSKTNGYRDLDLETSSYEMWSMCPISSTIWCREFRLWGMDTSNSLKMAGLKYSRETNSKQLGITTHYWTYTNGCIHNASNQGFFLFIKWMAFASASRRYSSIRFLWHSFYWYSKRVGLLSKRKAQKATG
jgi:hypothetical protein